MTAMLDQAAADPQQIIADLQRKLDARTAELEENKERYALVSQAVAEGIYDWDIDTNALWVSPRLIEIFGLTEGSLSAADWNTRVHPDDFERYRTALRDCFKTVTARLHCEYRIQLTNGEYRWLEDHGLPTRDGTGRAVRLVGAVSDITERKEAEQALREALEQQTATAEVLQVINSSPGDLTPVFDVMLEKALHLCEATFGRLSGFDGQRFPTLAVRGVSGAAPQPFDQAIEPDPGSALERIANGDLVVHIADLVDTEAYRAGVPSRRYIVEAHGARTALWVALRKDAAILGVFIIYRQEVRPFTDKQIALVQNFAAQAVVAIENARLLSELQARTHDLEESLEYQTATSDVLKVISGSSFDVQPVFETILETAARLCDSDIAMITNREGEAYRVAATFGGTLEWDAFMRGRLLTADRGSVAGRTALEGQVVHVHDLAADPEFTLTESITIGKNRTSLGVPLLREGIVVGVIALGRMRVQPFTDRQIELVRTFADQAVIALENARLLGELRERTDELAARNSEFGERIEHQSATIDVLKAMSASPGDPQPVFDLIIHRARDLCNAEGGGLFEFDGELVHLRSRAGGTAAYRTPEAQEAYKRLFPMVPTRGSLSCRAILDRQTIHVRDMASEPGVSATVRNLGYKSQIVLPLLRDGAAIGAVSLTSAEIGGFSDSQVALMQTFAEQAVIAITSAETYRELQQRTGDLEESLEYQTATSDVLKVISRSTFDLQPVLDTLTETAARLCLAEQTYMTRREGDAYRFVTAGGSTPEATANAVRFKEEVLDRRAFVPGRGTITGRAVAEGQVVQIIDAAADPEYTLSEIVTVAKIRTLLGVPLMREGEPIGTFNLARQRVEPFTERQIELVRTFADQAVIAIENARLLGELQQRTGDLQESLEYQTATSDVLKVISRSTFDLSPVLEYVVENAIRLCRAQMGSIFRLEDGIYRWAVGYGLDPAYREIEERSPITPGTGTLVGRVALEGRALQIADALSDPDYAVKDEAQVTRARTMLGVPLLREGAPVGVIAMARDRVEPFSDKEIALVTTFADQAVIAIENARLLTEQREALEQQTATAEVLRVISGSATDLQPVFEAITARAAKLCEAEFSAVARFENGLLHLVAVSNLLPDEARAFHSLFPRPPTRGFVMGRAFVEGHTVHIEDVLADPDYDPRTREVLQSLTGYRSFFGVPILRDGKPIGVIGCARRAVKPFTAAQIELVSTFADQAVIAIENARLFNDLRDRTDELAQRQAELRVTFDNMADGVVMFDEELRLAAWNRNFQEILELPDAFLAEPRTYAEYIRYLAERGEFGPGADPEAELRRVTERAGEHYALERTRSDGRVIEVRHNPVPSGGFVLIYADITERKRSEAEIRAARDAAEEASRTIEAAYQELKTAQARLIQAEKMASLGQLTAGIAHEIKNPLNFVNNFAGLSVELLDELKEAAAPALAALDGDKLAEVDEIVAMLTGNLEKIAEHGRRADGIVRSMLEHSRGESGERRPVDLNALVEEALNLAYHGARAQDQSFNISLERDFAAAIAPIELVPQDVTRVLLNLIGNGFYAATKRLKDSAEPNFRPALTVTTRDLGEAVEIRVRDNGAGIMPEIRDKLFQPFFTTKPTGEGTGLGLSISYDIVTQQHGGTIAVDSRVGEFTEFAIHLPRTRGTAITARMTA